MQRYLRATDIIDAHHPLVIRQAQDLARAHTTMEGVAQACFEFVRDQIAHSWDARLNPVTCKASDVLTHRTGYCYAKSHLLAALLRANQIPAGLCYQRVSVGDGGAPYCLHGINAIYLLQWGWYRVDARGNKPGIHAQFKPPQEHLAFPIREAAEADLPEIWADPLPIVIETLTRHQDITEVANHLPDIELWTRTAS